MSTTEEQQSRSQFEASQPESALPTGLDVLDRHLDGGLYPGSIVALIADPVSQSELLLSHLTKSRNTLYLSLHREPEAIRTSLQRSGADMDNTAVRAVGADNPLDDMFDLITEVDDDANIVIDPMNAIEGIESQRLVRFLNAVKLHVDSTGGLLVLHCLRGGSGPANRGITTYLADVVLELQTDFDGDTVDNRLLVPKVRGGKPFPQAIKLNLTDTVSVDTSREIT